MTEPLSVTGTTKIVWAAVGLAFGILYYPTFLKLVRYWALNDMYSYAFLVPMVCVYVVSLKRGHIRTVRPNPSFVFGLPVLLLGLLMLLMGRLSSTNLMEELSLPVTVCGLTLLTLGTRLTGVFAFPVTYLFAMVPFWDIFTIRLQPIFQLYSALVGVNALRLFGIPVLRQGFFIELPGITLEVADVCSGVNNLVAVLCIGVPLTYLFVRGWFKRAFIILMAVIIALLSNGVRVALISVLAYWGIRGANGDIHGPYSLLRSFVISGVGFLVLFWLISKFSNRDLRTLEPLEPAHDSRHAASAGTRRLAAATVAVVLVAGVVGFQHWHSVVAVPLERSFIGFPYSIGDWESHAASSLPVDLDSIDFDERLSRSYRRADGAELNLFVGYFEQQDQGRELVGEQMRSALKISKNPVQAAAYSENRQVNEFVVPGRDDSVLVTYWYTLDGRTVAKDYEAKLYSAWTVLTDRRSNGGIVVVTARVPKGEQIDAVRNRVRGFVEGVLDSGYFARG